MRLGLSDSVCHHEPVSEEQETDAASTVVKVFSGGFFPEQRVSALFFSAWKALSVHALLLQQPPSLWPFYLGLSI